LTDEEGFPGGPGVAPIGGHGVKDP